MQGGSFASLQTLLTVNTALLPTHRPDPSPRRQPKIQPVRPAAKRLFARPKAASIADTIISISSSVDMSGGVM